MFSGIIMNVGEVYDFDKDESILSIKSEIKKYPLTLLASAFNENEVFLLYYVFIMKNKTKKKVRIK